MTARFEVEGENPQSKRNLKGIGNKTQIWRGLSNYYLL